MHGANGLPPSVSIVQTLDVPPPTEGAGLFCGRMQTLPPRFAMW
jgi:hypothetical protein